MYEGSRTFDKVSKSVGIIAIKTERTQTHFLSDVLVVVALLDLKVFKPMTYTAVKQSLLNSFEVHGTDFREAKLVDKGVRHTT